MSGAIDPALLAEVAGQMASVRARIERACRRARRDPGEITLVGASKRQPLERIAAAVGAGLLELGENYVQEARDKQAQLAELLGQLQRDRATPEPRWRMIGHLQRNKARHAVRIFHAVDTVDRSELAEEIDRRAATLGTPIDICLQVNLSGEKQKAGLPESELPALLRSCQSLRHLRVRGLMTIPAGGRDPEASRATFARLRELRDTLSREHADLPLCDLNMGMSADLEVAVEEGATVVRVGTALFGPRDLPKP